MAKTETPISQSDIVTGTGKEYTVSKPARKKGQLLGMSIDRTGWVDATATLTVVMKISMDNGKTWTDWCSVTAKGGAEVGPGGQPMPATAWACSPPLDAAIVKVVATSNGKTVQQPISLLEVS